MSTVNKGFSLLNDIVGSLDGYRKIELGLCTVGALVSGFSVGTLFLLLAAGCILAAGAAQHRDKLDDLMKDVARVHAADPPIVGSSATTPSSPVKPVTLEQTPPSAQANLAPAVAPDPAAGVPPRVGS